MAEIMVPNKNSQSIVVPLVSAEQAVESWNKFEELKTKVLREDDYQVIGGKRFIKRSGFRKIAVFFGISDRILREDRMDRSDGSFSWRIEVEVSTPNGRTSVGVGACDSKERKFAHTEHDVYATAHTRAKSRAISDMVAGGIVSAEEMNGSEPAQPALITSQPGTTQGPVPPAKVIGEDTGAKWVMKVPVTKNQILNGSGYKQFDLGKGDQSFGMFNILDDMSEASIVPENPIAVSDSVIQNFLLPKVFKGIQEKSSTFAYQLDVADGFLHAILLKGLKEEDINSLLNASRWAFEKALARASGGGA